MSQHAQSAHVGPPRAWIAAGVALVIISVAATGYMISGPTLDGRDAVGFLLGVTLTGFLAGHTVGLIVERAVAYDRELRLRAERWAARQEVQAEPEPGEVPPGWVDQDAPEPGEFAGWTYGGQPVDDSPPLAPPTYPEPAEPEPVDAQDEGPVLYPEPSPQEMARWTHYGGAHPEPLKPAPVAFNGCDDCSVEPGETHRYAACPGAQPDPVDQATAVLKRVVQDYRDPAHRPPYDRHTMPTWNAFTTAQERQAALSQVAVPLPPREPQNRPYVDPGPYSTFVGVPVSPGHEDRELGEADTVVIQRIEDTPTSVQA